MRAAAQVLLVISSASVLLAGSVARAATPDPDRSVALLAAQVDRLEAAESVKRLQRAYGYYIDKGYWDEAADLFADDATFEAGVDGVYVGSRRIRELIVHYGGGNPGPGLPYGQINHHLQLQPVVHVAADGRTALGRWRELALLGQFQKYAAWGDGIYECEYVKEGTVWKIRRLRYFPNFVAPYEGGWAKLTTAKDDWQSDVARQFPSDRPPTLRYRQFPDVFVPPFHYTHPVPFVQAAGREARPQPAASGTVTADCQHRIERLSSREDIENLQAAYGYYVDKGLWDQATELFSKQASYEYGQRGVYVGRAHIRRALTLFGKQGLQPGQLNNYMMLQPIIDVSADNRTAKARWRSDIELAVNGKGQWGEGTYENEYVRENGEWRISKLHFYVTFIADYDAGWIDGAVPMERPSTQIPPDRQPSERYESLPGVYLPAYHYDNPVTGRHEAAAVAGTDTAAVAHTPELAGIERRITRLEDQFAIEKVQRAYGYYVDKAMWPQVADLFAETGTLEIGGRGVFVGKRRALEYLVTGLGPIGLETRHGQVINHQQFQGIVTVAEDGRTAHGRWTALVMGGGPRAGSAVWGDATYENTYVKEDGVWKIAALHAPFNMYSFYRDGWAKQAVPNTRPDSFEPPPDLPPTVLYLTYPSYYNNPFHYPNPVTGHVAPAPNPAAGGVAPMRVSPAAGLR
jgi:hypothetical protein